MKQEQAEEKWKKSHVDRSKKFMLS